MLQLDTRITFSKILQNVVYRLNFLAQSLCLCPCRSFSPEILYLSIDVLCHFSVRKSHSGGSRISHSLPFLMSLIFLCGAFWHEPFSRANILNMSFVHWNTTNTMGPTSGNLHILYTHYSHTTYNSFQWIKSILFKNFHICRTLLSLIGLSHN